MRFDGFYGNAALRQRLGAAFSSGRVTHSYLLCGPEGSGRHTLARILAAAMQCTGTGELPCGVCAACRKVMDGQHPDVIPVNDPDHKQISVDIIRRMRADMFIRPNEGKRKIYILEQDMGEAAQNALLKVLEEPPTYGVFLILAPSAERLLATIRSRCTELKLSPLAAEEALPVLRARFPAQAEEACRAALVHAGGYLGQAVARLESGKAEHTDAFAAAFAGRDALAMLALLLPMEKFKRDALTDILEQWRALLSGALAAKSGFPAQDDQEAQLCRSRTGAELLGAEEHLREAIGYLNANVGAGAVIGWLTCVLR